MIYCKQKPQCGELSGQMIDRYISYKEEKEGP